MKIISGGQTGVDRGALDAALELGLPIGGWCPKGRRAEDGRIPDKYPLKETEDDNYAVRTERNVRDSDGTLIITRGKPKGGTAFTLGMTRVHKKPYLVIDLAACHPESREAGRRIQCAKLNSRDSSLLSVAQNDITDWLTRHNIRTLNIAGPRESNCPGIYEEARRFLVDHLKGSPNN